MLEKVSTINYERCYPKRLKKFFQSNLNYKTYQDFVPYTQRAVLGNIPSEIINLFKTGERENKIKAFQELLAKTAETSRVSQESLKSKIYQTQEEKIEELVKRKTIVSKMHEVLTEGFKDLMPEGTQAEVEYIGYGGYKDVYRLGLKDKNGKKIMHDKALLVYKISNAILPRKSHGLYAEPNSWYYLQRNIGHSMDDTQFTKHYISDLKNGYSITEFIDDDIVKTTNEFDHNRTLGIILADTQNNPRKKKKVYDIGGLIRCQGVLKDRTSIKYFKKIANRHTKKEREEVANRLTEQAKNPKTPLRKNILEALDYYKGLPPWYFTRTSDNIPIRMIW